MKIFKKALPVFMAAMLIVPTFGVHAAELPEGTVDDEALTEDNTADEGGETEDTPVVTPVADITPSGGGKSWNVGKNDPTEVVATYRDGVLTFVNEYVFDIDSGAEELPNPGLMKDSTLSEINDYFNNNDITDVKVVIGNGVKNVGTNALSEFSAISEVDVRSGDFKEFKQGAFSNCSNLKTLNMTTGKTVGAQAFAQCSNLTDITLSESLESIEASAFTGVGAVEVDIPSSVKSIKEEAFSNSKVAKVTGGEGVTSVGARAFSGATKMDLATEASDGLKNYDWVGSGYTDINAGGVQQVIVTYNTKGGNPISNAIMTAGEKLTPPKPVYSGMTFDGWFTDEGYSKPFADGTEVTSNITLYAKWHGDYVTITFETNNGMAASSAQVKYGDKPAKPADPTPSGDQVFGGWFTDSACTKAFSFDTALTSDITVYAKWGDATFYTVKFDTDGGAAVDNQSVKAGSLATRPADPTKTDFKFDSWYKDKEWKDKWDFDKDKVNGDTTIYARFLSNKVTVKFDTQGGSAVSSVVVDRGGKLTNPGNPTKDNCEFLGWYKDAEGNTEFNIEAESINDNMTLYAKWNQTAFTVKWESNGGSTVENTTANPNALIAKPADPIKAGYYLVAWCKDSDLKNQWNFDADKVTADITLYALWAPGDPATVDGANPGVTNTGAKAPQTGDVSNPLFHLFAGITGLTGAAGTGIAGFAKRKRKLF